MITDTEITRMDREKAIEIIMDIYGNEIKRLIYTYLNNTADTDDVTQEVFIQIYRKLQNFQGRSSLRSWIYSIAIHKSKDHLRSWRLRNKRIKEKLMHVAHTRENKGDTPEENAIRQSESDKLLNHVMNLKVKYREVIILFHFEELTTKEISNAINMKEATVRTRLKRGREKLHTSLLEIGGELNE